MSNFKLTPQQIAAYHQDGYIIVKNFLTREEVTKLHSIATGDDTMKNHAFDLNDLSGKKTKLALWYTPGDDAYGLLTKSERMVHSVNQLMDGATAVCHFHSKLMQKEPRVGGAWEWHQDYGYWYKNEFLFPDQMISVMIAITEASKANGCLQVIKGTHKMGRIEHGFPANRLGHHSTMLILH
jgi:phytanoyl-CoA hydroxylase